jgi:hypothetical protein
MRWAKAGTRSLRNSSSVLPHHLSLRHDPKLNFRRGSNSAEKAYRVAMRAATKAPPLVPVMTSLNQRELANLHQAKDVQQ